MSLAVFVHFTICFFSLSNEQNMKFMKLDEHDSFTYLGI